jgi:hypothetical protein
LSTPPGLDVLACASGEVDARVVQHLRLELLLDSSSTCPTVGEVARNGFSPLALKIEVFSSATQPSRIGLGSISGAADARRADLEQHVRRTGFGARAGHVPSTVPAITCTPTRSGCR